MGNTAVENLTTPSLVFPAADGFSHPYPSVVLPEETQVVCAEEQKDCIQASQVKGTPPPPAPPHLGLKPSTGLQSVTSQHSPHHDLLKRRGVFLKAPSTTFNVCLICIKLSLIAVIQTQSTDQFITVFVRYNYMRHGERSSIYAGPSSLSFMNLCFTVQINYVHWISLFLCVCVSLLS